MPIVRFPLAERSGLALPSSPLDLRESELVQHIASRGVRPAVLPGGTKITLDGGASGEGVRGTWTVETERSEPPELAVVRFEPYPGSGAAAQQISIPEQLVVFCSAMPQAPGSDVWVAHEVVAGLTPGGLEYLSALAMHRSS
ncbi:MAG TPA: hypothetical protein VLF71_02490 [Candidatus Saccharimonadales bacterium]|nr:hypothetical protein [Candidatus Saccharimonadales bacterium]